MELKDQCFLCKDQNLQQRWISEVVRLTNFSQLIIEGYVTGKKKKWKIFRKWYSTILRVIGEIEIYKMTLVVYAVNYGHWLSEVSTLQVAKQTR